ASALSQCVSLIINFCTQKDAYISLSSTKYFHNFASIRVDYRNTMISDWFPTKPDFYIIEADDFQELDDKFRKLSSLSNLSFNPRAKHLFIVPNITVDFLKFISALFIRDVFFLNPEALDLWSPFQNGKEILNWNNLCTKIHNKVCRCRNNPLKMNTIDHLLNITGNKRISKISAVYIYVKYYSTCPNCTKKGIIFDIFDIIADHLEIEVEYSRRRNRTEKQVLEKNDVFIRAYTVEIFYFSEFTMSCLTDEWSWFVPTPQLIPRWKYLNNIFELRVWLASFALMFIFSVVWTTSKFIFDGEFAFFEITIAVFKLFVEQSHDIRKNYVYRAILAVSVIFFVYFMNTFLKCRFTYLLNGVNYQDDISSFDDIKNNKIHIGFHISLTRLLNYTAEMKDYLEKFRLECGSVEECLERAAFQRDIAVLHRARIGRNMMKSYIENNGESLLKEIEPPFIVMQNVIDFQRGHPLFPIFNKYLYNLVELGIAKKVVSKYDPKIEKVQDGYIEQRALTTEHLVIPLVFWVTGILCSTIIFIMEELENESKKKRKMEFMKNKLH
ncbi:hypothetical protein HHI36_014352, partial [Cryptolaemus montrouzieri]